MSQIDWSQWHKIDPVAGLVGKGARISVSATKTGRVYVTFSHEAQEKLGWIDEPPDHVEIFEGTGEKIGTVLVRVADKGHAFHRVGRVSNGRAAALTIRSFMPDWAPDFASKSTACSYRVLDGGRAVEIDLPGWFDRDLAREVERREAAE